MNESSIANDLFERAAQAGRVLADGSRLFTAVKDPAAQNASAFRKLMNDMVELAKAPERFYRDTWAGIEDGSVQDLQAAGETVFHFWDLVLHEIAYFREWAVILEKCGIAVPAALGEFEAAAVLAKARAGRGCFASALGKR
ncbi:MAG: hypothetical protein U0793_33500 [Gemmataceae bacterium]